jgi:hypothetical protein
MDVTGVSILCQIIFDCDFDFRRAVTQKEPAFARPPVLKGKPNGISRCGSTLQLVHVHHPDAKTTADRGISVVLFVPKVKNFTWPPRSGQVKDTIKDMCNINILGYFYDSVVSFTSFTRPRAQSAT